MVAENGWITLNKGHMHRAENRNEQTRVQTGLKHGCLSLCPFRPFRPFSPMHARMCRLA